MISKAMIRENLTRCLETTSFLALPGLKKGKVRDAYDLGDKLVLVTTDRQSAFDRVLACVPFKGQVLNQVSAFWFEATRDIVANQILGVPDPNVTVAKKCRPFPVEFVVRGYLTGTTDTSAWMLYSRGTRDVCGNILPEGMVKNQTLPKPILTPTTKSVEHDRPLSAQEIVKEGLIEEAIWNKLEAIVFGLFQRGAEIAARNGLILVDTKYELGLDENGEVTLIDEVHTPDSSRYWLALSYEERIAKGLEPENIDKEFLRLWFKDHCDPYHDKDLPKAPDDLVVELSSRYILLYEMITGKPIEVDLTLPVQTRIVKNLAEYL
jgi:phosphoribosylaminoimidazole-succinocarboxamide synthase